MNLRKCILTENDCYKSGRTISPTGIMVHSTGAPNPWLKRYVGPDDGLLGYNSHRNHWNQSGIGACVHAFIGKLEDGTIATYQTLPWNYRGWHAASGNRGSANNTHISFEICEDGLDDEGYFRLVFNEAVELCAYLCQQYNIDPISGIICHSEGNKLGIASNHADVMHWFPRHGENMDTFRECVANSIHKGGLIHRDEPSTGIVVASALNIRKLPFTSSEVIGVCYKDESVEICGKTDNGWYEVKHRQFGVGYVYAEYVNIECQKNSLESAESNAVSGIVKDNTPDTWALDAVDNAIKNGILYGDENGNYKLHNVCTRQEMLVFLHRIYKLIK